jgi:magnesium transporter
MTESREQPLSAEEALKQALTRDDVPALEAVLQGLSASEGLRLVLQLGEAERSQLFGLIDPEVAARLVEEAPAELAAELVEELDAARAARIIEALDSDDQVDLIGELEPAEAEAILAAMDPEDAADVRRLIQYDFDTAGGLMMAETFAFRVDDTVGTVLRRLGGDDDDDFERYRGQHPYIVDAAGRLQGVVSLRNLLSTRRNTPLGEVMTPAIAIPPTASLDEVADLFADHPFLGLPVVDPSGMLIGVVSRTALAEAIQERMESESLKIQGVIGDELRSMPTLLRSRRRLAWLSANIVLNIIAASVISAYEETLAAVIAIAVFLPMVSDMSGCSGNQAVAVSLRELALGLVRPADMLRVWLKEVSIGVLNGLVLGLLIGVVAWVWKGNPWLGVVIGAALALNTIIAVSIGGVVPLLLKRLGTDPAVASSPLLTTVTDMAGFFLVLSLATLMMPLLVT